MPLYRPQDLHAFLSSIGAQPKKGLSQNFLIDGNIIRKIVASADVKPGSLVMEVGPGPGALTEELLRVGARVLAVEKDHALAEALSRLDPTGEQLSVIEGDVLELSFNELKEKMQMIANLPYHVTTPILTHVIKRRSLFSRLTLMVQEEVARRFSALPGTKEYGSITIFLNFYADVRYLFSVGHRCFYPAPKVDSAIVQFTLKEPPHVDNEEAFFEMVRKAFHQRRKMLRASLRKEYGAEKIVAALKEIGLKDTARPEELSLDEFLKFYAVVNLRMDSSI